ncbi:MAG TPA: ABC transporter permease subunit, partial [Desulfobacteraceae bacterium]|nr:ABC transporter permease subunit [Desulfobacteraceae bacterium]
MIGYFVRRFFLIIPTFVGITIMVFAITRFVPGGPIDRIISNARQMQAASSSAGSLSSNASAGAGQPLSESQIQMLKSYYGFDKPVVISYFSWLGKVLTGDLGHSTRYYDPVWSMIKERIPISLYFGLLTMVLVYGVCIPLGMAKAVKHKSGFDNISSVVIFVGYAIPGWVAGVMLLVVFASNNDIFPLGGLVSDLFDQMTLGEKIADIAWHTVLPLFSYVIGSFTVMTLLMKNTLMDNLASDYVRTAIAKG